jgi:putative membrane protein
MVGGHYTYAGGACWQLVVGGMGGTRNNYDKLGHGPGFHPGNYCQGSIDTQSRYRAAWLARVYRYSICLAISAFYELIEWWVALLSEEAAESFLGTQVTGIQSDMFLAMVGAGAALASFQVCKTGRLRQSAKQAAVVSCSRHGRIDCYSRFNPEADFCYIPDFFQSKLPTA